MFHRDAAWILETVNLESSDFCSWLDDVIEDEYEGAFWLTFFNELLSRWIGEVEEQLTTLKKKVRLQS